MIKITGGRKEQVVREWFNSKHDGGIPKGKVLDLFSEFEKRKGATDEISYGSFNAVVKKLRSEGFATTETLETSVEHSVVEPEIINIKDLRFPNFNRHCTGKKIDELFSDHDPKGGVYGGTVTIVIGESGVGKSTVMLDTLATIRKLNPKAKVLYVSSEMTRNDIAFYYMKTPSIGEIPTLLLMDYVKSGNLSSVLETTFNGDHDIILLDSYQDTLIKLKEVHNWRSTFAESWLTNMMIDAGEKKGCAVFAIQHMTKGGTYVGSTYLKHATTAMMEIRFDNAGQRYVEFSKNRRGGSKTNKRLYYSLDAAGDVVYDVARFAETEDIRAIEASESTRQQDLTNAFENIFLKRKDKSPDEIEQELDGSTLVPEKLDEDE
jgi:predicted ATP-dependent serine protease